MWTLLASVTVVALLFVGVYPVRTYLAQRASLHRAERQMDVLKTHNDKLAQQAQQLNTDSEIYGGSGFGNRGAVHAVPETWNGRPASATIAVPPLGAVWLVPDLPD